MSAISERYCFPNQDLAKRLDALFAGALQREVFSGASLLVAKRESILISANWGATRDNGFPVDGQSLFDLASLTKPLITAPLCMHAVSEGLLDIDDPIQAFFHEEILPSRKKAVTIRQILSHCSGFSAYEPFYLKLINEPPDKRSSAIVTYILNHPLTSKPGTVTLYSDLGFILLGAILENLYGKPLDVLADELLLKPLGLNMGANLHSPGTQIHKEDDLSPERGRLGFLRLRVLSDPTVIPEKHAARGPVFVATENCRWRKRLLEGEVHDENSYCMGGVAGHAGLFGNAQGIFRLLGFFWKLYRGELNDKNWSAEVVKEFWTRQESGAGSTWALGFDTPSPSHSSAGRYFSPNSVGHLGFTGTSFWLDLDQEILVILLTNRVYPSRENEKLKAFRPVLHDMIMEECRDE